MREILFRGKRKDNGEWAEGGFFGWTKEPYIVADIPNSYAKTNYEVIPETVGQYTGLTDKKGKKIFEGDIVHAVHQSNYIGIDNTDFGIGVVKYLGTYYGGAAYHIDIIGETGLRVFSENLKGGVTVIGNIHDNPELLKGGASNGKTD